MLVIVECELVDVAVCEHMLAGLVLLLLLEVGLVLEGEVLVAAELVRVRDACLGEG